MVGDVRSYQARIPTLPTMPLEYSIVSENPTFSTTYPDAVENLDGRFVREATDARPARLAQAFLSPPATRMVGNSPMSS